MGVHNISEKDTSRSHHLNIKEANGLVYGPTGTQMKATISKKLNQASALPSLPLKQVNAWTKTSKVNQN